MEPDDEVEEIGVAVKATRLRRGLDDHEEDVKGKVYHRLARFGFRTRRQ